MPIDPTQLAQDKDFAAASQNDQIKYLASQDPDFAKASPADQIGYLNHIKGVATPAPQAGAPAQQQSFGEQNFVNPMAQSGADLLTGIGKGALSTVQGVGSLINKAGNAVHSGLGDKIVDPSGLKGEDQMATTQNTTQKVGYGAEALAEGLLGDEALKGLSLGDKLLKVSKLAETYEKASPFVKAAIETGLRGGTGAGLQTTAKTGDVATGAKAAAVGAAGGTVLGGAGNLLGKGLQYLQAAKSFDELPGALDKALGETVSNKAVADGLAAPEGTTAVEKLSNSALKYQERAKQGYQTVDNAVNGDLGPVQDKLRQLGKAIKMSIDPEVTDKLISQQEHYQELFKDAIERAKANGVPDAEDVIKAADSDYAKFRAQSDLATRLAKTAGPNGAASPAGLHVWSKQLGTPKVVGGLSRMEQALGTDGAEAVQKIAAEGRNRATDLAKQAQIAQRAKTAAVVAGSGALGTGAIVGGYHIATGH